MTLRICSACKREYASKVPNQNVTPEAIRAEIAARRYIDRHPGQGRTAVGRSFEFCCPECRESEGRGRRGSSEVVAEAQLTCSSVSARPPSGTR